MMDHQDFGKRLQALEDLEAIKNLHRDYIFWLNARDWDKVVNCFAQDAQIHIFRHPRCNGIEEIRHLFFDVMSKVNSGKGRDAHFATMPVIKVNGTQASGHWMLYILIADPVTGNALKNTQGRYECEYVKVAEDWKFSKLAWVNPWPRTPESKPRVEEIRALGFDY
jgi:ketosteroid isomerase-like protein